MITREFNLYLHAGHSIPLVINVNQYDSGEQWVFTLYNEDGTQYIPSTGAIVGIKSDGLGIINTGSVVDGKVVINETQQMTAAIGKATFELTIDSQTHGTANFIVLVEEKPGNNADLSESDLSLIQEALNATSPLPTGGTVGQVLTKTANGSAWSDAGTPTQEQVAEAVSDWADENITVSTGVVIDTSLAVAGAAADSKKVGDELSDLKSHFNQIDGDVIAIKSAMVDITGIVPVADFEIGTVVVTSGSISYNSSTNKIRTKRNTFNNVKNGDSFAMTSSGLYKYFVAYSADGETGWVDTSYKTDTASPYVATVDGYYVIVIGKIDNSAITQNEVDEIASKMKITRAVSSGVEAMMTEAGDSWEV